jgi:phosphohistidine phosphatase
VPGANRLVVLRHAKATHEPGFRDIDRPLTPRGQRDAAAAGRFLRGRGIVPDLVLCSSSARTTQTWDHLTAGGDAAAGEVSYEARIYDADADELLEIIEETPAGVGTLMIIGHNPAAQELVFILTGERDLAFPTCALALIDLPAGWSQASAPGGRLDLLWTPKQGVS